MKLSIISSAKHLRKQRCHYTRDFGRTWLLEDFIISLKALSNIQARQLSKVTFRFGYSLMNNLKKRRTIMSSWHLHEAILALKLKKKSLLLWKVKSRKLSNSTICSLMKTKCSFLLKESITPRSSSSLHIFQNVYFGHFSKGFMTETVTIFCLHKFAPCLL